MNIHEAVLQPIAAFVYCNRHAAASSRRQAEVGNFYAPQALAQSISAHERGFAKLFYDGTTHEIK